ncbi:MAG: DUF904 domain-containing protein [Burkholderiaceae bacterium]
MISDFDQLAEKVAQLAALAQALRRENSELRLQATALAADNADLAARIEQAQQRLSALLASIPAETPARELV